MITQLGALESAGTTYHYSSVPLRCLRSSSMYNLNNNREPQSGPKPAQQAYSRAGCCFEIFTSRREF